MTDMTVATIEAAEDTRKARFGAAWIASLIWIAAGGAALLFMIDVVIPNAMVGLVAVLGGA